MRHTILLPALLFTGLIGGCGFRPSAPPLQDGPVYSDAREGFRFFVPDGWKQWARGQVPAGKIDGERMLAEYKCLACSVPSALAITVADVPASTSLSDYLTKNTLTGEDWRRDAPPEEFTINGAPAARLIDTTRSGNEEVVREIVAFRRGERVYFFKGFYAMTDAKSRRAVKAAAETIVW